MVYIKVKKKFESAFHAGRWPHGNVLCIIDITPILALNEKRSHSSDCETIFFFFFFRSFLSHANGERYQRVRSLYHTV